MQNLWIVFTTGLLAGGVSCAAVQGGLLATAVASQPAGDSSRGVVISSFLFAKLVAYTLLGFILGWIGGVFTVSLVVQSVFLTVVSLFMIGNALAMLDVHPFFRHFLLQPPKIFTRFVRTQSKSQRIFGPALLGASTVFIPCGTTQAMMALALTTRQPAYGALILFMFVLGTIPLFFLFGWMVGTLKDLFAKRFVAASALVILAFSLLNLRTALVLSGVDTLIMRPIRLAYCTVTFCSIDEAPSGESSTDITMRVEANGYVVDHPVIPAGKKIRLTLVNAESSSCTQSFTIPSLGVQEVVPLGKSKTISFTAPTVPGDLAYVCGMGMYGGTLKVVQ